MADFKLNELKLKDFLFYWQKCVLKNYINFNGRARRKEFWMFTVANAAISIVIGLLNATTLSYLFSLALLLPSLAVWTRRLHDIGKSWQWLLLLIIPLIGWIILIVWAVREGEPDENQYGSNPKLIDEIEASTVTDDRTLD
jgi:uncharacterized membrane protein YhaH (DUF805 family)